MAYPEAVGIAADNVALRIDPEGETGGYARVIDGGEDTLPKQEPMSDTPGNVEAGDVALGVDGGRWSNSLKKHRR